MIQAKKKYIELQDLEVYRLARQLSKISWEVFDKMGNEQKKLIGTQFIRAVDSVGANIAEGYGRFGFLDKVHFYHFSRGSLFESRHWAELMEERKLIDRKDAKFLNELIVSVGISLNMFIGSTKEKAKSWH